VSSENVEFVRSIFAGASSLGKQALLDALPQLIPQLADPGIEWATDPAHTDSAVYRGHEGVLHAWRLWLEQWDDYHAAVEDLIDCGDNVLVVSREQATGAGSGASVSSRVYAVVTVRNKKITRWRTFYDEASAWRAAGVETHGEVLRPPR
jgi:ketosteroid isomerase-like protein